MDLDLSGRVVAITAASRGIGRAIAGRLAAEGASVAIAARSVADLQQAHAAIEALGGHCLAFAGDLADPGEAAAFVAAAAQAFGRLDGLVCCVPASGDAAGREGWDGALALGLLHPVEALAMMADGPSALFVAPDAAGLPGRAARAALNEAVRVRAPELAQRGVRLNLLLPHAGAAPSSVAEAAAFLLSARSGGVTGAAVPVAPANGGW